MSVRGFKSTSANKNVIVTVLFLCHFSPQSYVSALLAKASCHGDDGVFDPKLNVLLQAVPPTYMHKNSLTRIKELLCCFF